MFLSDGYIANCSGPWKVPNPEDLTPFENTIASKNNNPEGKFLPYKRDEKTLARPWATPGTKDLMHRIGGLEKSNDTGNVDYDPSNHQNMTNTRAEKIERIAQEIPPLEVNGPKAGDLLVLGWGSTEGTLVEATEQARQSGLSVAQLQLHYISPLPSDLEKILKSYKKVLIPEINCGQLSTCLLYTSPSPRDATLSRMPSSA